jgi:hypothetical protein
MCAALGPVWKDGAAAAPKTVLKCKMYALVAWAVHSSTSRVHGLEATMRVGWVWM